MVVKAGQPPLAPNEFEGENGLQGGPVIQAKAKEPRS